MSVGDELLKIYEARGELTPKVVIDEARDPSSPLHEHFEWDPQVAHWEYLVNRARYLIRRVKIKVVDPGDVSTTIIARAFVSLPELGEAPDARHYVPTVVVAEHDDLKDQALEQMEADFIALRRKWATFAKAFDMMVARHITVTVVDGDE